jgi:hypothetical protein
MKPNPLFQAQRRQMGSLISSCTPYLAVESDRLTEVASLTSVHSSSMATIKFSPLRTSPSLCSRSSRSPQNAPKLALYSHPRPSLTFPSICLKSNSTAKPRALTITLAHKNLSETELVAVPPEAEDLSGKFPSYAGVYAVYDQNEELQFIGISRDIAASVTIHRKSVPELCCSVKVCHFYGFTKLFALISCPRDLIVQWKFRILRIR